LTGFDRRQIPVTKDKATEVQVLPSFVSSFSVAEPVAAASTVANQRLKRNTRVHTLTLD
jgi:hypothetical protein